jgi:hypothetical protein
LGTCFTLHGENVIVQVFRTGRVARVDDWTDSTVAVGAMANVLGVRSAVASVKRRVTRSFERSRRSRMR